MNLSMECVAFPDILTESEEAPELVTGNTISLLLLGCNMYCQGFDIMIGILLSEAGENSSGGTVHRKVGTGEIKLRNCDEDEDEFRGKAVDGLAWHMAHHLKRRGCVASVVVV